MKKLKDEELKKLGLKKYVMKPHTKFMGGIVVNKDTKFEDVEEDNDEDKERGAIKKLKIEQTFENLVLTTKTTTYLKLGEVYEDESVRTTKQLVKDGQLLVFVPENGWGITNEPICEVEKAIKDLNLIK